jgi:hypothetical protein
MLRLWTKCTDKQSITKLNYTFTKGCSITQNVYISFSIFIFQCVHICASTYRWQLRLLISVGDFALSVGALCNYTTRPEYRHPLGQTSFCLVRPTPISYPIFSRAASSSPWWWKQKTPLKLQLVHTDLGSAIPQDIFINIHRSLSSVSSQPFVI